MEVNASVVTERYLMSRRQDGSPVYGLRFLIVVEHEDGRRWIASDWTTDFSVAQKMAEHTNLGLSMGMDLDPLVWRLESLPAAFTTVLGEAGQAAPLYS